MKPTKQAYRFMHSNDASPVISGAVKGGGGEGGHYTLENGEAWELSLEDCQTLLPGYPKWKPPKTREGEMKGYVANEDLIKIGNKIIEMADRVKVGHAAIPGAQTTWGFEMDGTHFTIILAVAPEKP